MLILFRTSLVIAAASTVVRPLCATDENRQPESTETQLREDFYRPDEVQDIHLRIDPVDLKRMQEALPKRIYVEGSFQWGDRAARRVAIRFKGNSSSNPHQQHKRSFLVKFDEYDENARFLGMEKASFDNGVQFGSLFSEPIMTGVLRDLGIRTHRANYARLFLNGEYRGVFVNVERIDASFLERHWPRSKGALFKVDEGGPGGNLQYLGQTSSTYKQAFELKSGKSRRDYARLVEFIKTVNQPEGQSVERSLGEKLNMDEFTKVMAVMLFSGAFDQLTGRNPHNYYLFYDETNDEWHYLPWDLDVGFSETAFERLRIIEDWNAAWPLTGDQPNPLIERIMADPATLKLYRSNARQILLKYFDPQRLSEQIDRNYALIRSDLKTDPFPHRRVTNPGDRDYADIVDSMKRFFHRRYSTAKEQLDNPGERPPIVRRPQRNSEPMPGTPSKSDPSELTVVSATSSKVVVRWKDNADDDIGTILQRADGPRDQDFRNRLGQPGRDVTDAADDMVESGKTYRYRVFSIRRTPMGPKATGVSNVVTVRIPPRGD